MARNKAVIGWREWVGLPDFDIAVKAKIDTGARTSSLHARRVEAFERDGIALVRFWVYPKQRTARGKVPVEAPLIGYRRIRNPGAGGRTEIRPVIVTMLELGEHVWQAEVTLSRRDTMGFRMLLGRQAVRGKFTVDPGTSFKMGRDHPRLREAS
ncbi:MAG: ATP-dependent zinc protease [Acidimicrobiia bacterium]|nr:ATP-dependent zinc protease [Acidimicrobiia bacterium]